MKGILLAGGTGTRLYPITITVNKHLLPVYDKPLIYYPLSILMIAGIREILLISTPHDLPLFKRLLGDGSQIGISLSYAVQPEPAGIAQALIIAEEFCGDHPRALILGDNLFYGNSMTGLLQEAAQLKEGGLIFAYHVSRPQEYGVVEFDAQYKALSLEEKPSLPKSSFAVPGLYFYGPDAADLAKTLSPSNRGEIEITDLNRLYLEQGRLKVVLLGRGIAWLDTGSHRSLMDAGMFIQAIEERQGLKIACIEEIAFRQGWIGIDEIKLAWKRMGKSAYAEYLKKLVGGF